MFRFLGALAPPSRTPPRTVKVLFFFPPPSNKVSADGWVVCLMLRCTKEEFSVGTFGEMQMESPSCLAPTFNMHWIEHLILSGSHQAPTRPDTGVKRLPKGFQDQGYEIVQPGSKYANLSIVTERKMLCYVVFVWCSLKFAFIFMTGFRNSDYFKIQIRLRITEI